MTATELLEKMRLQDLLHLADTGQIVWTEFPPPPEHAKAMRCFEGVGGDYRVLVLQANTPEHGIVHEGTVTLRSQPWLARLTAQNDGTHLASYLWHKAAAGRN